MSLSSGDSDSLPVASSSCWPLSSVAAGAPKPQPLSSFLRASVREPRPPLPVAPPFQPLLFAGQPCFPLRLPAPSLQAFSPCPSAAQLMSTANSG